MTRENFNRYENDRNYKKGKQEKKIRNPVSKGSVRTKDKETLKRAIHLYEKGIDPSEYYDDYEDE